MPIPAPLIALASSRTLWAGLAVALASWMAYSWAYDRGFDTATKKHTAQITKLGQQLQEATDLLEALQKVREAQDIAHAGALKSLALAQKEELDRLTGKLDLAESTRKTTQEKLDAELRRKITPAADAQCVVPVGFVRFHDLSAQPNAPASETRTPETPAVSQGGRPDVDRPSGVALSTVARTIALNYQECRAREEVIEAWQGWYTNNLAAWVRAVEQQGAFSRPPPPQSIAVPLTN